jgi:phosphoadenosine phosphosulfate reductase
MKLSEISNELTGKTTGKRLEVLASLFGERIVFTTSFGIEDQVITHMIFSQNLPVKVVTLDTGRLFPETYKVFSATVARYKKKIHVYFPDNEEVENMVTEKGPFSFYESKENRLECCRIRKVIPLDRALKGMECWISGIRAGQSDNRSQMNDLEYDDDRRLFRYHPLFDWSHEDVTDYIKENAIPYNTLHDQGFVSIGCQPCTRAVLSGQDSRSGRWWWENDGSKECGLHLK